MALLVEGLGVGGETSVEEYIVGPTDELVEDQEPSAQKDQIRLFRPEQGRSLVARPVTGQSVLGIASRQGSTFAHMPLMDPVVALFGSVYEKLPDAGSKGSMLFPHLGSMFSVAGNQTKYEYWDEENLAIEGDDYASEAAAEESDDNLQSPLISRQTTSLEKDMVPPPSHGSIFSMMQGNDGEPIGSAGIGGGWQLAWKWTERESDNEKKEGDLMDQHPIGPAMIHPSEASGKGPSWRDLFEPGVQHALIVGVGIQILQQFSGINGVMYYTPQILEQAGVGVLLSNLGISSASASLLISAITNFLMLPSIAVAMRLMDISGMRSLLLGTIPILIIALIVLVIGIYAIVCVISWIFVFLKVPETKGMPLEVISEFFVLGAKQAAAAAANN
uniref:Sugar transporter n=1 Tax=Solanum tuberosum TaxID=4113 RepID=M1DAP3_SOLTU